MQQILSTRGLPAGARGAWDPVWPTYTPRCGCGQKPGRDGLSSPVAFDWVLEAVLLAPLPLIVIANLGVRHLWARITNYAVCATLVGFTGLFAAVAIFVSSLYLFSGQHGQSGRAAFELLGTAGLAGLALLPWTRSQLARFLPIEPDNPVHMLALVLTVLVAGAQLWLQLSTDVVAAEAAAGVPVGRLDLVGQELPLLLAALAGIGLVMRRGPNSARQRLGWVLPRWWQVVLALAAAGLLFGLANVFELLSHWLTPDLAHKLDTSNERLLGHLNDPSGIATIALSAGICEEALFRGALQPRLGIIWTSVVFASFHTQYGLSFDTLAVLILGCGLGLLRRFFNTTSSTVTHTAYNVLAATGLGALSGFPFVVIEAVLFSVGAAGIVWQLRSENSLGAGLRARPNRQ